MPPKIVDPRRQQGDESLFIPPPLPLSGLTVRLMQPADVGWLHDACYPDRPFHLFHESCRRALTRLSQGRCYPIVAVNEGELVGHAQLVIYARVAEIADLAVANAWQGQGVGTALIMALTQIARYTHQSVLEIGVYETNQRALTLYQRLGFIVSREIKLPPKGEKGIILERLLSEQL